MTVMPPADRRGATLVKIPGEAAPPGAPGREDVDVTLPSSIAMTSIFCSLPSSKIRKSDAARSLTGRPDESCAITVTLTNRTPERNVGLSWADIDAAVNTAQTSATDGPRRHGGIIQP